MYRAADVMGFAGGFTLGMVQAGFELVTKCELPGAFGVANCEANRHLLGDKWETQVGPAETWQAIPGTDVVFGNPPCSGFSVMSAKEFRGADSKINACMWSFADYVIRTKPQIAVFESVQQAFTNTGGQDLMRQLRAHVEAQTGQRWRLYHVLHNAYSVGGCAQRKRYFWLITRIPFGIEIPRPTILPLLNDVIGDLAHLPLTWQSQPYRAPLHPWAEHLRSPTDTVDGHMTMNTPLHKRIKDLMNTVEWRPGEHLSPVTRRCYETVGALPESWQAFEKRIIDRDFQLGFTTPTRWRGDRPARVITGGALQTVIHPWLPRTITHREAARIIGFPDNWYIQPLRRNTGLHMTWGKGISVACGRWIGEWIMNALNDQPGSHQGKPIGDEEQLIDVTHTWKQCQDLSSIKFPVVVQ